MAKKYKKKILSIPIRGITIDIIFQDHASFCSDGFKDSYAYCDWINKKIVFQEKDITQLTVIHELTHMYMKTGFVDHIPDLTIEQTEEMFCEVMSYFGAEILRTARLICKELKKHKRKVINEKSI